MMWIFAAIMAGGVAFLLISIFLGDFADIDTDVDVDVDVGADTSEARNLGCMVIAAFMTGFGSMGLVGELSGWNLAFSLAAGAVFGLIFGRSTAAVLNFVIRQQSTDVVTSESLIGAFARITVNIPPGKTGEAMVEAGSVMKYPVKASSDEVLLEKGDIVEVVDVREGRLIVKKKRNN